MTWIRIPRSEFNRIRKLAAGRKSKRDEKRKALPWGGGKAIPRERRKKSERSRLVKQLDNLYSLAVRARDKKRNSGLCIFGCGRPIQCVFHFITRSKYIVRWDMMNGVGSCYAQNYENEFNPHPYIQWYRKNYGDQQYDELVEKSNKIAKFSNSELLGIKTRLEYLLQARRSSL